MNLQETIEKMGVSSESKPVGKSMGLGLMSEEDLFSVDSNCPGRQEITATFGDAQNAYHFAVLDVVPPKPTVPVVNPNNDLDKRERRSKKYRQWEQERQRVQDAGPKKTVVQTIAVDNSDIMDQARSNWFV